MTRPRLDRDEIRHRGLAQPRVEVGELVTEEAALAFFEDLKLNNPVIYNHIKGIIDLVDTSLARSMINDIAPTLRRGIIARAAIAGAAQIVSDTGQSFLKLEEFKEQLGITNEVIPTTDI